jgi:hypothetical protein
MNRKQGANLRLKAARIITAMERGARMRLTFARNRSTYNLSDGTVVAADVALAVINDVRIVTADRGLFAGTPQSWKYREPRSS